MWELDGSCESSEPSMLSDENLATNYLLSHQIQEALIQFYNLQTINIFTSPSSMLLCSQSFSSHDNPNKYLDKNQTDFHPVESLFFDWSAVSQAHAQLHIPGGIYLAQSKWWLIIGRVIFWTTNIRPSQEEDQYISSLTRQHCLVKQAKVGDEHCITATSYLIWRIYNPTNTTQEHIVLYNCAKSIYL